VRSHASAIEKLRGKLDQKKRHTETEPGRNQVKGKADPQQARVLGGDNGKGGGGRWASTATREAAVREASIPHVISMAASGASEKAAAHERTALNTPDWHREAARLHEAAGHVHHKAETLFRDLKPGRSDEHRQAREFHEQQASEHLRQAEQPAVRLLRAAGWAADATREAALLRG
jgi:hypothetical protein